ncbi:MAG: stage V sporulation protein AA [Firmicutes bacterium]|nr:stage V sporulation protein AA [Bacillota bacterium]
MNIYVKPKKKANIYTRKIVYLKDIADVAAEDSVEKIKNVILMKINDDEQKNYLIDAIDIIKAVTAIMPKANVSIVGEEDTVVEYLPEKKKESNIIKNIKITLIVIILFAGASTAIMSFHSDAQMAKVFENYYEIFYGEKKENPMIIDLPYSIGLAAGIIVFFNHISGKKLTADPTPIEVELSTYEKDVTDNIIDTLNSEGENDDN